MKYIISLFFLLVVQSLHAQDSTYYDIDWRKVSDPESYEYLEIVYYDRIDSTKADVHIYYKNGQTRSKTAYSNYSKSIRDGVFQLWSKDGDIERKISYKAGVYHGDFITYWKNGTIKRVDKYDNEQFISGTCWDEKGNEVEYFPYLVKAEYPGGRTALSKFLRDNLVYPEHELEMGLEGRVVVLFDVDETGLVVNISLQNNISEGFDREALRVVNEMQRWSPAIIDGVKTKVRHQLPVSFRLN